MDVISFHVLRYKERGKKGWRPNISQVADFCQIMKPTFMFECRVMPINPKIQ